MLKPPRSCCRFLNTPAAFWVRFQGLVPIVPPEDSIAGTTSVKRSLASFWAQGSQESDLYDILVPCRPQALGAGGSNTEIGCSCRPPAFEVLQAANGHATAQIDVMRGKNIFPEPHRHSCGPKPPVTNLLATLSCCNG